MRTVGALALVLVLAGCGGTASTGADDAGAEASPAAAETFTASGTFALMDYDGWMSAGGVCGGTGGYDDIQGGAQVTIRDADGTTVALGALEDGHRGQGGCVFDFTVPDVPAGGGIYSVEVSHRGEVSFNEAEADTLALTLG